MEVFEGRLYVGKASEAVAASVALVDGYVQIQYGDDGTSEDYSVHDISVEEGGHLGDRVKISFANAERLLVLNGHQFLEVLEKKHPNLASRINSGSVKNKVKFSQMIRSSHVAVFLGVIGGICLLTYLSIDVWVDLAADKIPVSVEEEIGKFAKPDKSLSTVLAKAKKNKEKRKKKLERIRAIGKKLVTAIGETEYKFHFDVLEKKDINAYALPGGYVYVLDGLIKEAKSDDEIAGVVGHEIGHVIHRDSLRRLLHQSGLWMCLAIVTGGSVSNDQIQVLIPTMQKLEALNYSRGQEANADKVGVELAIKAGYNPEALSDFFIRLEKKQGSLPRAAAIFVSDHPMNEDRVKAIKEEAAIQRKKLGIPEKN